MTKEDTHQRRSNRRFGRDPDHRRAAHEGLLAPKRQSKGANIGGIQTAFCSAAGQQDARSGGAVQGDDAFTHIRFGAGYQPLVSSLGAHTSVRAELWGQYSPDRLPAVEQFDLGGNSDGREARSRTVPRPGAGHQGRPGVPVNRR
jgi:hypothetical protein